MCQLECKRTDYRNSLIVCTRMLKTYSQIINTHTNAHALTYLHTLTWTSPRARTLHARTVRNRSRWIIVSAALHLNKVVPNCLLRSCHMAVRDIIVLSKSKSTWGMVTLLFNRLLYSVVTCCLCAVAEDVSPSSGHAEVYNTWTYKTWAPSLVSRVVLQGSFRL